jgi:hypothetical protein
MKDSQRQDASEKTEDKECWTKCFLIHLHSTASKWPNHTFTVLDWSPEISALVIFFF